MKILKSDAIIPALLTINGIFANAAKDIALITTASEYIRESNPGDKRTDAFATAILLKYEETGYLPTHLRDQLEEVVLQNEIDGHSRELNCGDCAVPVPLWGIWDYGCWCNFGDNLMTGFGDPVNSYDAACKKFQLCFRCTVEDDNCDPSTLVYSVSFSWLASAEALMADCTSLNGGDPCKTHACCCEMNLINNILTLLWSEDHYDPQYKHSSGWEKPDTCLKNNDGGGTGEGRDFQCCGVYPDRIMYNADHMQCCGGLSVYNPMTHECCGYGEVHGAGNCPMTRRKK